MPIKVSEQDFSGELKGTLDGCGPERSSMFILQDDILPKSSMLARYWPPSRGVNCAVYEHSRFWANLASEYQMANVNGSFAGMSMVLKSSVGSWYRFSMSSPFGFGLQSRPP